MIKANTFRNGIKGGKYVFNKHNFPVTTNLNDGYETTVAVYDIVKGFLKGEFTLDEIYDLVSQGIGGNYAIKREAEIKNNILATNIKNCCAFLEGLVKNGANIFFVPPADVQISGEKIEVIPTFLIVMQQTNETIVEAVVLRSGRHDMSKESKREHTIGKSIDTNVELYALNLYAQGYAKQYLNPMATVSCRGSYWFLRKKRSSRDQGDIGFDAKGNIASLNILKTAGTDVITDGKYDKLVNGFVTGKSECDESDCKTCTYNAICNYIKTPERIKKPPITVDTKKNIVYSDEQLNVINFTSGIARVNAGAGSGKTECMTERGARMLRSGVSPESILFITFTNAGASEMKERIVRKMEGTIDESDIQAMTFNAFAYEIVKEFYEDLGYTRVPEILNEVDSAKMISSILEEHPIEGLDYKNFKITSNNVHGALGATKLIFNKVKELRTDFSSLNEIKELTKALKNMEWSLGLENGVNRQVNLVNEIEAAYNAYEKKCIENNFIDLSDQERMAEKVLNLHPEYLEARGIRHLIVDEFQDSNAVQCDMIKRLMQTSSFKSLMVVGDDDQSIYGFRNTSPYYMVNFFDIFGKGYDYYLNANRRSTAEVINLANTFVKNNKERVGKLMNPTRTEKGSVSVEGFVNAEEEYRYIVDSVKKDIMRNAGTISIQAGTNTELVKIASLLSKENIPFILKNPMKLSENSKVIAAQSVANMFYDPEAEENYLNYMVAKHNGDLPEPCVLKAEIEGLKQTMKSLILYGDMNYQRKIYHDMITGIQDNDEIYQAYLDMIFEKVDLPSELQFTRDFRDYGENVGKRMEDDYPGVILCTIHSFKGKETDISYISLSKLSKPAAIKKNTIEESRRLIYVAITRARDKAVITGVYKAFGKKKEVTYNVFLKEIFEILGKVFAPPTQDDDLDAALAAYAAGVAGQTSFIGMVS